MEKFNWLIGLLRDVSLERQSWWFLAVTTEEKTLLLSPPQYCGFSTNETSSRAAPFPVRIFLLSRLLQRQPVAEPEILHEG
ncbi:hypothetical protein PIB30_104298, partial [Stylosanthes scabra]|nr:hypothetical protein [Stylosanthes scabra]